jgi:predicted dehydrogenase
MVETILVIGCGSIGLRHLRNLRALGIERMLAYDPVVERRCQAEREAGAQPFESLELALAARPDAALICTPPHLHLSGALAALDAGAHLFLEKPIAHSLDGLDSFLDSASRQARVVLVGYNWRFHAAIRAVKELLDSGAIGRLLSIRAEVGQYLPDWRPSEDYRLGYNARADLGGGIIMDASHEIDYVCWLGGDAVSVYAEADKLSPLEIQAEDTAALLLRLKGNVIAEIHLDCTQRGYARNGKLIGTEGTLTWDYREGLRHVKADGTVVSTALPTEPNDMYVEEIRHFLACIRGQARPLVTGEQARRVLEIALAARKSAATGQRIRLN